VEAKLYELMNEYAKKMFPSQKLLWPKQWDEVLKFVYQDPRWETALQKEQDEKAN